MAYNPPTPPVHTVPRVTGMDAALRDLLNNINLRRQAEREQRERDRAAVRALFSGDCLECLDTPDSPCPHCRRGQQVLAEERDREIQRVLAARRALMVNANIPERYWSHTLDTYPWQQSPALLALRAWLANWDGTSGLILSGGYGRGKTGLMVAAMQQIARRYVDTPARMLFAPNVALMDGLRTGYDDGTYAQQLERAQRVRLLCLDDVARETCTVWVRERLFDIVNARYNSGLPILLTTNYDLNQLAAGDRLGEAIVGRLDETCDYITVEGANLRQRRARG